MYYFPQGDLMPVYYGVLVSVKTIKMWKTQTPALNQLETIQI